MFDTDSLSIVLLGNKSIGKRSLLNKAFEVPKRFSTFYLRKFKKFHSNNAIAIEFNKIKYQGKTKEWSLLCYDSLVHKDMLAEKEYTMIEPLNNQVISCADIIFLCYSCNDKDSFMNLQKWKEQFSIHMKKNAFIYLVGTKSDLETNVSEECIASLKEILEFDEHIKTSGLTGDNAGTLFSNAVRKVEQLRSLTSPDSTASEISTLSGQRNDSSKISTYYAKTTPGNDFSAKPFTMIDEMNQNDESKGKLSGKEIVNNCLFVDIDDIDIM